MKVELQRDGHVALIALDQPEARNAVNARVAEQLEWALDDDYPTRLRSSRNAPGAITRGEDSAEGPRAFIEKRPPERKCR